MCEMCDEVLAISEMAEMTGDLYGFCKSCLAKFNLPTKGKP